MAAIFTHPPASGFRSHGSRTRALLLLSLALPSIGAAACGYALAGRGSFLPSHIRSIWIPPIQNRTAVTGLEQVMTERIRAEFIGRGKYDPAADAASADAVLEGEITSIARQPVGLTEQQLGSRYLITVVMKMAFTDTRSKQVLWSNDALTFREEYDLGPGGGDGAFLDQQSSARERLANDVARTVVTAITEAF